MASAGSMLHSLTFWECQVPVRTLSQERSPMHLLRQRSRLYSGVIDVTPTPKCCETAMLFWRKATRQTPCPSVAKREDNGKIE